MIRPANTSQDHRSDMMTMGAFIKRLNRTSQAAALGRFALMICGLVSLAPAPAARAGTLLLTNTAWHGNPTIMGYDCGDFWAGSNTKDWWRYSSVGGVRMFINLATIEPIDALPPWGDGVTDQGSFLSRKTALRADPLNTNFINWSYLNDRFTTKDLGSSSGGEHRTVNYSAGALRQLNVQILAEIDGEMNPPTGGTDWPDMWELWQRYYSFAVYLARNFDVQRYQMANEPNGGSTSQSVWLLEVKVVADAVQSAIADVNALYGKSLVPMLFAPVTAGATYDSWGQACVGARHVNFLGVSNTNFWLMQKYDYHEYDDSPSTFGANMGAMCTSVANAMSPEPRFPVTISEFNVHDGANFDGIPDTLDTPADYAALGAIAVNLMKNYADEMYCFKFAEDPYGGNYPVNKNATHYVDSTGAPYNYGGINQGGEVWRLFNKGFPIGGSQLFYTGGSGMASLNLRSGYDPGSQRYYVYSANNATTNVTYTVDTTGLNLPIGSPVLLEEVSANDNGGGRSWGSIAVSKAVFDGATTNLVQPANSIWLFTFPVNQRTVQTNTASDNAMVTDGTNAAVNYSSATRITVYNHPTNASQRSAALIKIPLTGINPAEIQMAVLQVYARTPSGSKAQAHVYGLDNAVWSQSSVTWSNAPNLAQGMPAGVLITNRVILGQGNTAHILGQLVANSSTYADRYLDVTGWLRTLAPGSASATFLISQDPRWNVTLPSLAVGDTQADGIELYPTSAGNGPQLLLTTSGLRWNAGNGNWDTSTGNWVDSATPAGALTYSEGRTVTLNDSASGSGALTVTLTASHAPLNVCVSNNAHAYTLTGSGITGTGSLVKSGAGTLTLSESNSYTGATVVNQGTLLITNKGAISYLSSLTVAAGATLITSGSNSLGALPAGTWTIAGTVSGAANVQPLPATVTLTNGTLTGCAFLADQTAVAIIASGASNAIRNASLGLASSVTFSTPNATDALAVSALLADAGTDGDSLTKTGAGTVTLSGTNTYSGGTTLASGGGTLLVTSPTGLGSGPVTISKSGYSSGTLQLALTGSNTLTNTFNGFSSTTFSSAPLAGIENVSGANTITSDLTVTSGGGNGMVMQSDGGFLELAGTMSTTLSSSRGLGLAGAGNGLVSGQAADGSGALFLHKYGTGMWTMSGVNSYSGGTTISAGVLSVSTTAALPGWDSGGSYSVASGATLAVGDGVADDDLATMLGTGNFAGGASLGFDTSAGDRSYTPDLADTGAGSLGLTKVGANTLTLSGANTYSGTTAIYAGMLLVGSGGSIGGATITVASGATLGGAGTIGAAVTLQNGGTLAPGGLGALTVNNNLTLQGTAVMQIGRNGTLLASDRVTGLATCTCGGTLIITNTGSSALQAGDSFQLFAAVTYAGAFTNIVYPAGYTFTNQLAVNGSIAVASVGGLSVPATNLAIVAAGPASISVSGQGGASQAYKIYAQTNLAVPMTNWWLLGTTNANAGGAIHFSDTKATNQQRFYRFGQ